MDAAILKILEIRKRMARRVKVLANARPDDAVMQSLAADDAALCIALREAVAAHGANIGLSDTMMAASVEPKD